MYLRNEVKDEIVKKLSNNFNIRDIILFGSFAYGKPDKDSDIDLLVILNDDETMLSYSERIKKRVMISKSLIDIIKKTPVDILVHTSNEWQKLLESGSFFFKDIKNKGISII